MLDWHRNRIARPLYTFACGYISVHAAYVVVTLHNSMPSGHITSFSASLIYGTAGVLVAHALDLDDQRTRETYIAKWARCCMWALFSTLALIATSYGLLYADIGRKIVVCTAVMSAGLMGLSEMLMLKYGDSPVRTIFIIGGAVARDRLAARLANYSRKYAIHPVNAQELKMSEFIEMALRQREQDGANEVVIANDSGLERETRTSLIEHCVLNGVLISRETTFIERHLFITPIDAIETTWFEDVDLKIHHPYQRLRSVVDRFAAAVGLVALAPLLALAAAWILVTDGSPAILVQERLGLYGKRFRMFKLRTMRHRHAVEDIRWTTYDDDRVVKTSKILRQLHIDEIPQLWNVIKGEMAIIGPRPEIPELNATVASAIPQFRFRNCVKPGITGWAQVNRPYSSSIADSARKLEYDLFYIKYMSLYMDLIILLKTAAYWRRPGL